MDTVMDDRMQTAAHLEAAPETKIAPADGARKGSRSRVLTYAGLGALVLAAAGTSAFVYYDGRVSTDDAQVDAHIAPVAPKMATVCPGSAARLMSSSTSRLVPL